MCGISGMFTRTTAKEATEFLELAFNRLKHRGTDSYGLVAVLPDHRILVARSLSLSALLDYVKSRKDEEWLWFVAHNRKRSTGKISIETAHPIYCDNAAIIHNGTKKALYNALPSAVSDTHAILLFYKNTREELFRELVQDTGVFFIFDREKNSVFFHRDDSRPLFLSAEGIIASEPITSGVWRKVKEQDTLFPIESPQVETEEEAKEVEVEDHSHGICIVCQKSKATLNRFSTCSLCQIEPSPSPSIFGRRLTRALL